jgi:hypothetical protein
MLLSKVHVSSDGGQTSKGLSRHPAVVSGMRSAGGHGNLRSTCCTGSRCSPRRCGQQNSSGQTTPDNTKESATAAHATRPSVASQAKQLAPLGGLLCAEAEADAEQEVCRHSTH